MEPLWVEEIRVYITMGIIVVEFIIFGSMIYSDVSDHIKRKIQNYKDAKRWREDANYRNMILRGAIRDNLYSAAALKGDE